MKSERVWKGIVGPGGSSRADIYISESAKVLSRSQIKAREAVILVNGRAVKPSKPLKEGDGLEVRWTEEPESIEPEDIPLSILYSDTRALVVDKAQGMVTHPGAGNRRGTLANAVLHIALRERAERGAEKAPALAARAGIVHRLDKDTSGIIVAAKDLEAQVLLAGQFKERLARKEYLAITRGIPSPATGRIANRLGRDKRDRKRFADSGEEGKIAVTDYRVLSSWSAPAGSMKADEAYAFVSLRPKTGRTHQLRVHMASLGTPILGDPIYGKKDGRFPNASLMLHAYRLAIAMPPSFADAAGHPESGGPKVFRAPLPSRFKVVLAGLAVAFGRGVSYRLPSGPPRSGKPKHAPR